MADERPPEPPGEQDDQVALAQSLAGMLQPMVVQTAEQTGELTKWLLASLLAVNGGAIALTIDDAAGRWPLLIAGGCWLLGIAAALVSGLLAYRNGIEGQRYLAEVLAHLYAVRITGRIDIDFEERGKALERKGGSTLHAGVGSLLLFLAGAGLAALDIIAADPPR